MKYWKIPKQIIHLFLLYLAFIIFFAFMYHQAYKKNSDSFIIQSQYLEKELKIIDSLRNIQVEISLKIEDKKLNENLEWSKGKLKIYNTILNDSLQLTKKDGVQTPPLISFDKPDIYTRTNVRYPEWIRLGASPQYAFNPKFESENFSYSLSITDDIENVRRPDLQKKLNVYLPFSDAGNADSIIEDRFKYYIRNRTMSIDMFHRDIIKQRAEELRRKVINEEKRLKETAKELAKLGKKDKISSIELGFEDFFYFSTNIQTTGDLIDIIPNTKSVRTYIAFQRILSVVIVALVFTYYLGSKK